MHIQFSNVRIRRLFLPLLGTSLAFTLLYSLVNGFMVANDIRLPWGDEFADCWLPTVLAAVLVILRIRPTLRCLNLCSRHGSLVGLYQAVAVALLAAPTVIAQGYLRSTVAPVPHVRDAALIGAAPRARHYTADSICMHLERPIEHAFAHVGGHSDQTLIYDVYVMAPVCDTTATEPVDARVWLGLKFERQLQNSSSDVDKRSVLDALLLQSLHSFNAEDPRQYRYLETVGRNLDRHRFLKTLDLAHRKVSDPLILVPHREPIDQRAGHRLGWFVFASLLAPMIWWLMVRIPTLEGAAAVLAPAAPYRAPARARDTGDFLIPSRHAFGLPLLIDVNLAVFIAMVIAGLGFYSFDADDLLAWGANYRPEIHGLGLLRLLSSQFVHAGLVHLAGNLYGLLFAGIYLQPVATNLRLIVYYLLCGLGGSVASVIAHPSTISVGASGAIFGLFGIVFALVLLRDPRLSENRVALFLNVGIFIGLNLVIGETSRGVDNAAHWGGLVTGLLLGVIAVLSRRGRPHVPRP